MVTVCSPNAKVFLAALTLPALRDELICGCPFRGARSGRATSAPQTEAFDDGLVLLWGARLEIVEELAPLVDHLEQSTTRGVITLVRGEVIAQPVDALREQGDLNLGGSGVLRAATMLRDDAALLLAIQ
jgi:hypothetical protein